MRRNQHIGLRHYKWRLLSYLSLPIGIYLLYQLFLLIVSWLPEEINDGRSYGSHDYNTSYLISAVNNLWGDGLRTVIIIIVLMEILESIGEILLHLGVISKKIRNQIFSQDSFTSIPLVLFAAYTGIYKAIYLNAKSIHDQVRTDYFSVEPAQVYAFITVVLAILIFISIMIFKSYVTDSISRGYRIRLRLYDHPLYSRLFSMGFGGSARWANVLEYEVSQARMAKTRDLDEPYMGMSIFDDDPNPRPIGIKDDAHMVTIGMTGSGKSTTVLYNNLATYDGTIIAFDPKGELANNTFRTRYNPPHYLASQDKYKVIEGNTSKTMYAGAMSYVLDPYNETGGQLVNATYNPMHSIDLENDRTSGILSSISDGCVISSNNDKDAHWNEWAKNIIEALIVHVISRYPKKNHNLSFVLDLLTGNAEFYYDIPDDQRLDHFSELLIDMMTNDAFGSLPKQVATQISKMGQDEKGSVLSTTYRNLKWAGEPAMRKQLTSNDIDFDYLKTIYVVLPDDMIGAQIRWVRVVMSTLLSEIKDYNKERPDALPTWFIFDEFNQLGGSMDAITKGFPILRGFNIKLWLLFQTLSQVKDAFGEKWTDIIGASTVQLLGVNDNETAEWVSKRLGSKVNRYEDKKGKDHGTTVRERIDPLLTPNEVEKMLGKNSKSQIVFRHLVVP